MYPSPFNSVLEVLEAGSTCTVVCLGDEVFDFGLMTGDGRLEVGEVEIGGALHAWEDEVEVGKEAEPGEEGNPGGDEIEVRFDEMEERENDPVHEPWCQLCWGRSTQCFIGGEYWEEDCDGGARDSG